jgi:uncharacterized cupin superfamily protein
MADEKKPTNPALPAEKKQPWYSRLGQAIGEAIGNAKFGGN